MAQLCFNPAGSPEKGGQASPAAPAGIAKPNTGVATGVAQSPAESAYWAMPASTRAYMPAPGSQTERIRQSQEQASNARFAAAGVTDPFGYALQHANRNASQSVPAAQAPAPYINTAAQATTGTDFGTKPYLQIEQPKAEVAMAADTPAVSAPVGVDAPPSVQSAPTLWKPGASQPEQPVFKAPVLANPTSAVRMPPAGYSAATPSDPRVLEALLRRRFVGR